MSNEPSREEVLASIIAKSDQLNSEDLIASGPITVTVKGVRRGSKDQPIEIDMVERDRPFRPCKTVRRALIAIWGDDPKEWVGNRITIYTDPEVVYAGVKIGGLRVSHATGIDHPRTLMLTQTRGKKAEITIHPIADHSKDIAAALAEIAAAKTPESLKAFGDSMKNEPKPVRDAIRAAYASRQKELSATPLSQFESEIEAAKGSKSQLMALTARVDQFGDEAVALSKRIQDYWDVAAEGT